MEFVRDEHSFFDVVVIDLPDPNTTTLAKLYSRSFYALVARRLAAGGVMTTQATSPFFAGEAFWCIVRTIDEAVEQDELTGGLVPVPYHLNVPSFGEWGFVLAARHRIDPEKLSVAVPTRFLNDQVLRAMFAFGEDMQPVPVEVNRLNDPVLHGYYERGWDRFNE